MSIIETKDSNGKPNGTLIPIWHVDDGPPIEQVYLTSIDAGCSKGPHLHMKRRGLLKCIRGMVKVVQRVDGEYQETLLTCGDPLLEIPPGVPAALYNIGTCGAELLNMPSPPWRDNSDEHEVTDWTWKP